jgi:hemerythrin-like domain-containing protein
MLAAEARELGGEAKGKGASERAGQPASPPESPSLGGGERPRQLPEWDALPYGDDGWVLAHDSIRHGMALIKTTVGGMLREHVLGGRAQPWMGTHLQSYFDFLCTWVHHHHDNEEQLVFPAMHKKFPVPAKLSADHGTLMQMLDESARNLRALATGLTEGAADKELLRLIDVFVEQFAAMEAEMRSHLREEEEIALPLLRAHFTRAEMHAIEAKILKHITPLEIAFFLAPKDDAFKWRWMRSVAGIPYPVVKFVLFPAARRGGLYDRELGVLLSDINSGSRSSDKPQACVIA